MGEKCVQRETEEQRLWRWSGGGGLWWNVPLSLSLSTGNSSRREDTGYEGQANRRIDDRRPHGLAPGCRAKLHLNHPPWPLLRGGSHAYDDLRALPQNQTRLNWANHKSGAPSSPAEPAQRDGCAIYRVCHRLHQPHQPGSVNNAGMSQGEGFRWGKKGNQKEKGRGEKKRIKKKGTGKKGTGRKSKVISLRGRGCCKHTDPILVSRALLGKHSNTSSRSALASKYRAADTDYWREMRYAGPPPETGVLAMMPSLWLENNVNVHVNVHVHIHGPSIRGQE